MLQGQRSPFTARSRDGGVSAEVSMPAEASSMYRNLPAAPHKRPDPGDLITGGQWAPVQKVSTSCLSLKIK